MNPDGIQTNDDRTGLIRVIERFPEDREALQRLFRGSGSFQSLCDDYGDCLAGLKNWEQSTAKEAPTMRGAYADLLQELEQEVRQYLKVEADPEFWR